MFVTVWFGNDFCAFGSDEYVSLDTPLSDLRDLFPGCLRVELSGDDMND